MHPCGPKLGKIARVHCLDPLFVRSPPPHRTERGPVPIGVGGINIAPDSVRLWLESVEDQVPTDVGRVIHTSKSDLMARGVAFNLLQMAKQISPQCKAAEYEDLSGEKSLTLDCIAIDDSRSHQA